jgi:hypothetical protein
MYSLRGELLGLFEDAFQTDSQLSFLEDVLDLKNFAIECALRA